MRPHPTARFGCTEAGMGDCHGGIILVCRSGLNRNVPSKRSVASRIHVHLRQLHLSCLWQQTMIFLVHRLLRSPAPRLG